MNLIRAAALHLLRLMLKNNMFINKLLFLGLKRKFYLRIAFI